MKQDFVIGCEGDCERVAAVLVGWLKNNNKAMLKKTHTVRSPNPVWASLFEQIYTDEIVTHNLEEKATKQIIQLVFEVDNYQGDPIVDIEDLSDEELLDAFRELLEDDDDDDEEDDDNDV